MSITRNECLARDAKDTLAAKRGLFQLPPGVIYLDGNSLGVLPKNVSKRVTAAVERQWGETLIKSWNEHGWFHLPQKIGNRLARLIGAEKDSVVVGDSISVNLFKTLSAAVAQNVTVKLFSRIQGISRPIFTWRKASRNFLPMVTKSKLLPLKMSLPRSLTRSRW